jgi:hypothetical protein
VRSARRSLPAAFSNCCGSPRTNADDYLGTSDDIEQLVEWAGEPGALTRALVDAGRPEGAGFIEPAGGDEHGEPRYRIHDLMDHAPDYVAGRRAREMERKRPKTCGNCGATYKKNDPRSVYCSEACRKAAWRQGQTEDGAESDPDDEPADGLGRIRPSRETDSDGTPVPAPARARAPAPALER